MNSLPYSDSCFFSTLCDDQLPVEGLLVEVRRGLALPVRCERVTFRAVVRVVVADERRGREIDDCEERQQSRI